ncbi:hypothetical protein Cadr_000012258 [Camelus dromedarius]|uniref:Uncharacterized protein n=1 Tax=Camelus dromedarius TaxID=9838 RepID=A0A5N4DQV3_CAMDR|nr:hypothetical protein Cadr_000012258 [Camelus dromedarius]
MSCAKETRKGIGWSRAGRGASLQRWYLTWDQKRGAARRTRGWAQEGEIGEKTGGGKQMHQAIAVHQERGVGAWSRVMERNRWAQDELEGSGLPS